MVEIFGTQVPLAGLSAPALLALVVFFIMTGMLVPRRTVNDLIEDRNEWRRAHQTSEEERLQQAKQIDELLEVGRTVDQIMRALPRAAELDRGRE